MRAIGDFEDMLALLERHKVQYLIIGGVAFIYHSATTIKSGASRCGSPSAQASCGASRFLACSQRAAAPSSRSLKR